MDFYETCNSISFGSNQPQPSPSSSELNVTLTGSVITETTSYHPSVPMPAAFPQASRCLLVQHLVNCIYYLESPWNSFWLSDLLLLKHNFMETSSFSNCRRGYYSLFTKYSHEPTIIPNFAGRLSYVTSFAQQNRNRKCKSNL